MTEDFSWPPFLKLLDSDPAAAFDGFYRFAVKSLTDMPPRLMRTMNRDDFEDLLHEIIYHCVKDNYRVLRQYVAKGHSFAAWLYTVAHNKCLDIQRKPMIDCEPIDRDKNGKSLANVLADKKSRGEDRAELVEILEATKRAMAQMDERCRLLLALAAEEYKPEEMVLVLRMPPGQNKKVSDDLRYCREKLKKLLTQAGIDIRALL
ncbi:MAG: sigma-70 family RNA polymerase sigma factor [Candidatus Krumholzibacteria bacterium]|nr:sigma-70 family RNA polymerase sigma factor [Candidatus Krumholzibacteria bacterium]